MRSPRAFRTAPVASAWSGRTRRWLAVVVFAWFAIAAPVSAQQRPVGQIDAASGVVRPTDATVTRAVGGTTPARSLVRLYDGDRVSVSGARTRLTLFLAGVETPTVVTRANSPFIVRGRRTGASQGFVTEMFASLDLMFNRPRMAIATATEARGPEDARTAAAALPSGRQRLPEGERRLLVLWSGPASVVQVAQGDERREWAASLYASTFIDAPETGDFDVVLPGDALGWTVSRVPAADAPRAPGAPAEGELTADERLANAIWLIAEGDAEWRLFALSEVADLAQTDYGAARLLAATRADEIEPGDLLAAE
ncbi:MAG: hypothetical protein KKA16_07805 [Alphaproteobacteria bacterium]|nr:hypothetical protein [Alphaproteobacteria bacterium]MBU2378948.1 hypothetical protein [Alphaproteobacteria bacterium]